MVSKVQATVDAVSDSLVGLCLVFHFLPEAFFRNVLRTAT